MKKVIQTAKRIILPILFIIAFVLLVCESESLLITFATKILSVFFFACFYSLWVVWNMDEDHIVKKLTGEE